MAEADDYYFWLCTYSVNPNAAIQSNCPQVDRFPPSQCLCKNYDWYKSMYLCIDEFSKRSKKPQALIDSFAQFDQFCKGTTAFTLQDIQQILKKNPVTQTYIEANTTAKGAFLPNPAYMTELNVKGGLDYHFQHWASRTFGEAILGYVFGIIFLQILVNFCQWFLPSLIRVLSNSFVGRLFRKYFVFPALIGTTRARPIKFFRVFMLCIPPRMHTLLIAGYVLMSIVFLCYRYPIYLTMLNPSKVLYVGNYLGYRTGVIAMYNVPLLWLFAGRNNILIWLTGWQYEVFNHWHRWIARIFTLEILVHACVWTAYVRFYKSLAESWTEGYWIWGFVAFMSMVILCVQATKTFRALAYDVFIVVHVLFAIWAMIGMWYHLKYVELCQQQLYTAIAVWSFDRAVRITKILISGPLSRAVIKPHGDVMELTIKYSGLWKPRPGTYVFVHFLDPLRFWQSHPFTVVLPSKADEAGTLKLYTKVQRGITRVLSNKVSKGETTRDWPVWIDGPYGVEFNIKPFDDVALLAGGIGITAVYSHLIGLIKSHTRQTYYVHWAMRNREPLQWFSSELAKMRSLENVIVNIYITNPSEEDLSVKGSPTSNTDETSKDPSDPKEHGSDSINYYLPNFTDVVTTHIAESCGPICFFVCGPDVMADSVRYACAKGISSSKNYVQFFEESFTM